MNVHDAVVEKVRDVLTEVAAERPVAAWMVSFAREVLPSLSPRKGPKKAAVPSVAYVEKRHEDEGEAKRAASKAVYRAVKARAAGRCEACGARRGAAMHMDHFWGRAKADESVETCWMLCPHCDRLKTENVPSRMEWLVRFAAHCAAHRYDSQKPRIESQIALERAQHPGAHP